MCDKESGGKTVFPADKQANARLRTLTTFCSFLRSLFPFVSSSSANMHDLTIKKVITALCYIVLLCPLVDSATNAACDLVSSDGRKCYFLRRLGLTYADADSLCSSNELSSRLPSGISASDARRLTHELGLSFWMATRFQLHHDERLNRVQLLPHLKPHTHLPPLRWDFTSIDLSIYWSKGYYCARAVAYSASEGVAWAPTACNLTSEAVVCERTLHPEPPTPAAPVASLDLSSTNQTPSVVLANQLSDSRLKRVSSDSETGLLVAAIVILSRSSYYTEHLKSDLLLTTAIGLAILAVTLLTRALLRRTRRSSYFTVQGMPLAYVRSDQSASEAARNTCTSFTIRGYE